MLLSSVIQQIYWDALFRGFYGYEINEAVSYHGNTKVRWVLYYRKCLKMLPILKHEMKEG